MTVDPYSLDWGTLTADLFSDEGKEAAHVVNHDLRSDANRARTLRFLRARLYWFGRQLPAGTSQRILIDDRGQHLNESQRGEIRSALESSDVLVTFASEKAQRVV